MSSTKIYLKLILIHFTQFFLIQVILIHSSTTDTFMLKSIDYLKSGYMQETNQKYNDSNNHFC